MNLKDYQSVNIWMRYLNERAIIFVGCKVDLKFDNSGPYIGKSRCQEIYAWEVEKGIAEIGDYPYVETSAKVGGDYGTNIEYLMRMSFYEWWIQTKVLQRDDQQ